MVIELVSDSLKEVITADNSIINLLMVMVIIWTTGVLFRIIRQPPVIGELLAGFIFGPPVLGIIQPDETLHVLSELGIFFLMFYAGLETNPFELKRMTKPSLYVALGGFILPFALGFGAGYILGNESDKRKTQNEMYAMKNDINSQIVNVTNSNGSVIQVKLQRQGVGWVGTRGEYYPKLPTEDQLRPVYGF